MLTKQQEKELDRLASKKYRELHPTCFMLEFHIGRDFESIKATGVHHIFHRNHRSVRWSKENLVSVCQSCHNLIHNDVGFNQTFMEKYDMVNGANAYDELAQKARQIAKHLDFEEIKGSL